MKDGNVTRKQPGPENPWDFTSMLVDVRDITPKNNGGFDNIYGIWILKYYIYIYEIYMYEIYMDQYGI